MSASSRPRLANAQAYAAERRRAEALAQIDRAKTTFFSNVSHEFRTPLTLMQAPVEDLLKSPDVSPSHRDAAALVHRNTLRLQKLVNTLLDFSRIEAGRVQPFYEPTELPSSLPASRARSDRQPIRPASHSSSSASRSASWSTSTATCGRKSSSISSRTRSSSRWKARSAIGLKRVDDAAVLTVQDTGSGIPPEELAFVFDRFHRVSGTRGRTHEGTGIGLAIVHELVKLHGGNVFVQSEVDRGSTFTVTVPLGTAHLSAEALERGPGAASTSVARAAFVDEAMRWLPGSEADDTLSGFTTGMGDRRGHRPRLHRPPRTHSAG